MSLPIQHHPIVSAITAGSTPGNPQAQAIVKLTGFVGPASAPGRVRLYTALDDLGHYIEFDSDAIVHPVTSANVPSSDSPNSFWVKSSVPVFWIREYASAALFVAALTTSASTSVAKSTP